MYFWSMTTCLYILWFIFPGIISMLRTIAHCKRLPVLCSSIFLKFNIGQKVVTYRPSLFYTRSSQHGCVRNYSKYSSKSSCIVIRTKSTLWAPIRVFTKELGPLGFISIRYCHVRNHRNAYSDFGHKPKIKHTLVGKVCLIFMGVLLYICTFTNM